MMRKEKLLTLLCITTLTTTLMACGGEEAASDAAYTNSSALTGAGTPQACQEAAPAGATMTEGYFEAAAAGTMYSLSEAAPAEEAEYIPFNTEEYDYIKENSFLTVATSPLSTFAADVDTGSYTNFRRMVRDNYSLKDLPQGAIRVEEMINYFDYNIVDAEDSNRFTVSYETNTCPWNPENQLLMLTVKAKDWNLESTGNNFVFLIDSSGSMSNDPNKGSLAIKSFKLLAETLTENDRVSIVTYSGDSRIVLNSCAGNDHREICDALDSITFNGGTNGSGGITAAYELASENFLENGNNRVIIASDGDMNLGVTSSAGLTDLIQEKKETGVFLTVLGYGSGNYSDANMESIADYGNGNYYYIDCLDEANRVLVEKLKQTTVTVAKDVKLQVEFNPLEVSEYRLIGYENRTMAAEDFTDDTKDGGETGAGQTVTALYELVCSTGENKDTGLKYQTNRQLTEDAVSGELLTLSIRYKEPDGNQSMEESFVVKHTNGDAMSADFQLAAGVAELAMIINDSNYVGTATLHTAYELVCSGAGDNKYREELGNLIQSLMY